MTKCSKTDKKLLCEAFKTVDANNDNTIKKARRTYLLVNHPDKGGDKEKVQDFNNAYEACIKDSEIGISHDKNVNEYCENDNIDDDVEPKPSKETKSSKKDNSKPVPPNKSTNKDTDKIIKSGKCVRRTSNWANIQTFARFDSPKFDPKLTFEAIPTSSPKLQRMLDNIRKLDKQDLKKSGKNFKHFIYSDIKDQGYGAKIIASALISSGFSSCFNDKGSIIVPPKNEANESFGLLSSTAIYGKPTLHKTRKEILSMYNERPSNINGDNMRFIVLDSGFKEGIDLFDVKYVHIFEPQRTNADYQQAIGRATRLCGQKGLEFKPNRGWKLHVFNYESHFPSGKTLHEVYLKHSDLKLDEIKIREELERISIESAVDYDLNVHINKFSLDAQEDMNTKSHVNSTMTGGARKNPIDFSKIKCENGKCGARSTKQVPFTLVQMQAIYDTFKNTQKTYPKKKAKWLKETKSREKRQFFCNILNENKEFCERLIKFIKGEYVLPAKIAKKIKKTEKKELYKNVIVPPPELTENRLVKYSDDDSDDDSDNNTENRLVTYSDDEPEEESDDEPEEESDDESEDSKDLQIVPFTNSKKKDEQPETEDFESSKKYESFEEFQKRINKQFRSFKYDKITIENLCDTPTSNSRIVNFTPSQDFISHYFVPKNDNKGLLVWHSVGTGKTCTAIATKSRTWEKQDYTIVWVTRGTLKGDIWKNMFDKVCDYLIKDRIQAGEKIPTNISELQKVRKYISKKFLPPISFRQFSNACNRTGPFYERLYKINGKQDPFKKTLVIIDEVHKFFAKDLHGMEKANLNHIEEAVFSSYKISKKDSCKLLMMSATPIMDNPMDFIRLMNLISTEEERIPYDMSTFLKKYPTDEQISFTTDTANKLKEYFKGKISYLDRRYDPRQFVQPVFKNIYAELTVSNNNEDVGNSLCEEKLKANEAVEDALMSENIKQKCKLNEDDIEEEKNADKHLENLKNKEIQLQNDLKKLKQEKQTAVKNAKHGTKQQTTKLYKERENNLKDGVKDVKNDIKHTKKRIQKNKLKGKGLTKCVKNIEKETKKKITSHKKDYNKCLRNVKKKTKQVNSQVDVIVNKCKIDKKELI